MGWTTLSPSPDCLGYVRYFHPSDQAAATDWNRFATDGVRAVEQAKDPEELGHVLDTCSARSPRRCEYFPTDKPPAKAELEAKKSAPPAEKGAGEGKAPPRVLAWRHIGVGLGASPVYSSQRIDLRTPQPILGPKLPDLPLPDPSKPYAADLGGGSLAWCRPRLYADANGTLPRPDPGMLNKDHARV